MEPVVTAMQLSKHCLEQTGTDNSTGKSGTFDCFFVYLKTCCKSHQLHERRN
jgi:hypothetical protein